MYLLIIRHLFSRKYIRYYLSDRNLFLTKNSTLNILVYQITGKDFIYLPVTYIKRCMIFYKKIC